MALPTGVPWEEELSDAPYGKQEESGTVGPGLYPGAASRRAGRRALTSASSLHCGSEGNSSFTSSMVQGPRRVAAARPAAPPGWQRRQGKEGGRMAG